MLKATLRQLEIFIEIIERGNYSAAAETLDISQASVSKQISALEKNLGYKVFFRRKGCSARPTQEGTKLYAMAVDLMNRANEAMTISDSGPVSAKVRVGCGDIIARVIRDGLAEFHLQNPSIEIELIEMMPNSKSVREMQKRNLDLIYFTMDKNKLAPDLDPVNMGRVGSGIFASPEHPICRTWTSASTEALPIISNLSGSWLDLSYQKNLLGAGIANFKIVAHVQDASTLLQMAIQGAGAIFATDDLVVEALGDGLLTRLDLPSPELFRYKFMNHKKVHTPAMKEADRFISSVLKTSS